MHLLFTFLVNLASSFFLFFSFNDFVSIFPFLIISNISLSLFIILYSFSLFYYFFNEFSFPFLFYKYLFLIFLKFYH